MHTASAAPYKQHLAALPNMAVATDATHHMAGATDATHHVQAMGYILGKAEGEGRNWHGHVTAVTVAPEFRRQALAK